MHRRKQELYELAIKERDLARLRAENAATQVERIHERNMELREELRRYKIALGRWRERAWDAERALKDKD